VPDPPPQATSLSCRLMETSLYVEDVGRSTDWYRDVFGFPVLFRDQRACALNVDDRHVLLLFKKGASTQPSSVGAGSIPGHDGGGSIHVGFGVTNERLDDWERRLASKNVPIESRVTWSLGGRSIYFRDLDGHLLELLTEGTWAIY